MKWAGHSHVHNLTSENHSNESVGMTRKAWEDLGGVLGTYSEVNCTFSKSGGGLLELALKDDCLEGL